jgi:hypothetical protein
MTRLPNLDALRSQPHFQKLFAEVATQAPSKPGKLP